jgi:hypothetical protein
MCWVVRPETMEDAPTSDSIRARDNRVSLLRWLFSPEPLQHDESIDQSGTQPSFVSWIVAPERLEPNPPDRIRNDSQPTCEN